MTELHFKRLTMENWQQPDPILAAFVRWSPADNAIQTISGDDWAQAILAVELSESVPMELQRLFAVARGAIVYGYFFYPLFTLGAEQLFRLAETAVYYKCRELNVSDAKLQKLGFKKRVARLVQEGAISSTSQPWWEAVWELRNLSSHPKDQQIFFPGTALGQLEQTTRAINKLFPE